MNTEKTIETLEEFKRRHKFNQFAPTKSIILYLERYGYRLIDSQEYGMDEKVRWRDYVVNVIDTYAGECFDKFVYRVIRDYHNYIKEIQIFAKRRIL